MLPLLLEDGGEAAREVAELVARRRAAHGARDTAPRVDRPLDVVAQPADAPGQPRREREQGGRAEQADRQDGREQPLEPAVAPGDHLVRGLLDDHRAAHRVFHPDGVGHRHDLRAPVGRAPRAPRLASRERLGHLGTVEPVGSGRDVLEVLARLGQEPPRQRPQPGREPVPGGWRGGRSGVGRRPQRAGLCQDAVARVHHPDARARAVEPADQLADLGRRDEHGAEVLPRAGARGPVHAHERTRLRVVDVRDGERQPRPDERAGQPQLHDVAAGERAPRALDAVVRPALGLPLEQPGLHRTVRGRVEGEAQQLVLRRHEHDLHVVARGQLGPRRVAQDHVLVLHLEHGVDAPAVAADAPAEGERRRAGAGPGLHPVLDDAGLAPVVRAPVQDDRLREVRHAQVRAALAGERVHLAREEHARAVVQGGGDGARRGDEALVLGGAQQPLQLAHVLQADPGDQREQARDEQQLRRDRQPRPGQAHAG